MDTLARPLRRGIPPLKRSGSEMSDHWIRSTRENCNIRGDRSAPLHSSAGPRRDGLKAVPYRDIC